MYVCMYVCIQAYTHRAHTHIRMNAYMLRYVHTYMHSRPSCLK